MASPEPRVDTTYRIDNLNSPAALPDLPEDNSPSVQAPEKLYPQSPVSNPEPASSKEVLHDAPEVVEPWLAAQRRPTSPFSEDGTVVSGFQPMEFDEKGEPVPRRVSELPPEKEETPKTCGIPKKYFFGVIILIFVVLVALGLGLGLGLGLKQKNKESAHSVGYVQPYCVNNPDYCIGGSLGSTYYTSNGTFNGTGIALATEFWNHQEEKIMTVYFQHWTGEIRSIQLTPKGEWIGGTRSEVIATDAKNATPISTVSYTVNSTSLWHIFYIDENNKVRQKQNSNSTNIWQDGPLNDLNLTAYDAPNVGLQACWYGNYYGDSDASKFPTRDGNNNTIPFDNSTHGMHLWYPTDETTFRQYGWFEGQEQWADQHTWQGMSAHAGVGCYSWNPGTVTYAMMVDTENTAEVWWKDTNNTMNSTDKHPINAWKNASDVSIPNVYPTTSLGFTEFWYAQMMDGSIMGHDINWAAENTTSDQDNQFTVGGSKGAIPGLLGTHMSVTAVEDLSGGKSLYVFYQVRGDDLSVFTRDFKGGQWTQGELPIPDT